MKSFSLIIGAGVLLGLTGPVFSMDIQESAKDLRIIAPLEGRVVSSGQLVHVIVETTPGKTFFTVCLIGENMGIGMGGLKTEPPFEFDIQIPDNVIGRKHLTAMGKLATGEVVFSKPISMDVENPAAGPLKVEPSTMYFHYAGQELPLTAQARSPDGRTLDVRESSQIQFRSTDESVAVVSPTGMVTAASAGNGTITVRYGAETATVQVSVPKVPRGVLKGYGQPSADDLNVLFMAMRLSYYDLAAFCNPRIPAECVPRLPRDRRSAATRPADWRDLNGDGFIDYQDAEELVKLYANPH
jgi:hypothetical protein